MFVACPPFCAIELFVSECVRALVYAFSLYFRWVLQQKIRSAFLELFTILNVILFINNVFDYSIFRYCISLIPDTDGCKVKRTTQFNMYRMPHSHRAHSMKKKTTNIWHFCRLYLRFSSNVLLFLFMFSHLCSNRIEN